jgi:acetyltransferase-like isoleucine patch superfamily enzyme
MKHVGVGVVFGLGVRISNPEHISIGDNSWIDDNVVLLAGAPDDSRKVKRKANPTFQGAEGSLLIGRNCHIAQQVVLQAHGGLSVGDDSGVASGARIYTLSHHYRWDGDATPSHVYKFSPKSPNNDQSLISSPVVLECDSAIGLNSVVLPGSTVRHGSWVGVLSVVSGEVPSNSIASGSPVKVLKQIRVSSE